MSALERILKERNYPEMEGLVASLRMKAKESLSEDSDKAARLLDEIRHLVSIGFSLRSLDVSDTSDMT